MIIGRSGKLYNPRTVKIVQTIGRWLGYTLQKSTAVTLTSDYYDRCAARFEFEKSFWVDQCRLPDSFQTWFLVTQLHMWLISVRFRSMARPLGTYYLQEFVNHSFLDAEDRIRGPKNKITQGSLIKNYMKLLLDQHRGFHTLLDWSISREFLDPLPNPIGTESDDHHPNHRADQFLAGVIWRNLFGANWGGGMGGVKGIFDSNPSDPSSPSTSTSSSSSADHPPSDDERVHTLEDDVKFAENLERLIIFIRKELIRLDRVSDHTITTGRASGDQTGLTQFGRI